MAVLDTRRPVGATEDPAVGWWLDELDKPVSTRRPMRPRVVAAGLPPLVAFVLFVVDWQLLT